MLCDTVTAGGLRRSVVVMRCRFAVTNEYGEATQWMTAEVPSGVVARKSGRTK